MTAIALTDMPRAGAAPHRVLWALAALQGAHTVEHIAQVAQRYLLGWPPQQSSGILSPLNAEALHFGWNWGVALVAMWLLASGVRGGAWGWLFAGWALAHAAEHAYLFAQYLDTLRMQAGRGESLALAQGLPGLLGAGGWLSRQTALPPPVALVCALAPGLVTAPRLDVHFWWNAGETLLLAGYVARVWREVRG